MNTRVLLLLGCLLAGSLQAQESRRELWTWKDANGVTQYSDRPVPGARKVEMYTQTPAETAPADTAPSAVTSRPAASTVVRYETFEIWEPQSEQTFFGSDTNVDVRLRSDPELAPQHQMRLFLDGKLVEGGGYGGSYNLSNPARGAHLLEAVIVDEKGTVQARSTPVVFHVMQPSVIAPRAVGPALKPPPPKPQPKPGSPK